MGLSSGTISDILHDLHCSLERLSASLTQSHASQYPHLSSLPVPSSSLPQVTSPSSSLQLITQRLNPIPLRPDSSTPHRSFMPPNRPSLSNIIRADILSQPATCCPIAIVNNRPPKPVRLPPEPKQKKQNPVSYKLAKLSSQTEKRAPKLLQCGALDHFTNTCRNSLTCFRCKKTGHRAITCTLTRPPKPNQLTNSHLPPPTQPPTSPLLQPPSLTTDQLPPVTMYPRPI